MGQISLRTHLSNGICNDDNFSAMNCQSDLDSYFHIYCCYINQVGTVLSNFTGHKVLFRVQPYMLFRGIYILYNLFIFTNWKILLRLVLQRWSLTDLQTHPSFLRRWLTAWVGRLPFVFIMQSISRRSWKALSFLPYFRIPFRNTSWASAGLIKLFFKRMYLLPIISRREGKAHYNNGPPLGCICCQSQTVEAARVIRERGRGGSITWKEV